MAHASLRATAAYADEILACMVNFNKTQYRRAWMDG
jgi:hypothetical protein